MNNHKSGFPKRLRQLRNAKGLTQAELAHMIDASRNSIFLYEAGKRKPDIVVFKKLADYFGVTCDYMIGASTKRMEGEWKLEKNGYTYFCCFCDYAAHPREAEEWSFCPNCGVEMKGGVE